MSDRGRTRPAGPGKSKGKPSGKKATQGKADANTGEAVKGAAAKSAGKSTPASKSEAPASRAEPRASARKRGSELPPPPPDLPPSNSYWSELRTGRGDAPAPKSRAPLADLRIPQGSYGSLDAVPVDARPSARERRPELKGARPASSEAATIAPPSRKSRVPGSRPPESPPPEPSGPSKPSSDDVAAQDGLDAIDEDAIWSDDPPPLRESIEDDPDSAPAVRLTRGSEGDPLREAAAFGSSQSLLSTDYYFRQYGAHGMRSLAAEVDDFGFDPHVDEKLRPLLQLVCEKYFRVELVGSEQLPAAGRALMVANRGGTLPWDGLVLRSALRTARPELARLRWLAEDSVIHYPFMGVLMNRLGAVRACPENAERLLSQERLIAVFPEGAQGSRKLFRDRYRLQRFGRGGYVKLALKLGVPILPTAIIGAEDTNPVLRRSRLLGRLVGSETAPITPTFPWFGLAGLLPAPVRWRIAIGEPIDLSSYGPEAAEDALVVHRLNEQIRASLQTLVDDNKQARGSSLFG